MIKGFKDIRGICLRYFVLDRESDGVDCYWCFLMIIFFGVYVLCD